jgi:hypothetical protein
MPADSDRYWFPSKGYGWGWGPPRCRQGWVVLLGYMLLATPGPLVLRLPDHALMLVLYESILTGALLLVCWKKGEPPRRRWGDER